MNKCLIFTFVHFTVIVSFFLLCNFLAPTFLSFYYNGILHTIVIICIANITFDFFKRICLSERISPEKRAVFITGCDTGFGHKLAKRIDSLGFQVFAGCLLPLGEGASELKSKCSERLKIVELDVTIDESVKESLNFVKDNLGDAELWAVVNNAGVLSGGTSEITPIQYFKRDMEVNAFGTIRVTQAFAPLLRQSRGRIVNITSRVGRIALPFVSPYTVSKWASLAFTECLRHEVGILGIKVISIEPEVFKTGMTALSSTSKQFEVLLQSVDKSTRDAYGYKYLKMGKRIPEVFDFLASPNLEAVIGSLEAAICLKFPSDVYKPSRNLLMGIILFFGEIKFLNSLFFKLLMYLCAFQKVPQTKKKL